MSSSSSKSKAKGGAEKVRLKNKRLRDKEASTCQNLGSMFKNLAESSSKKSKTAEEIEVTEQVNLMTINFIFKIFWLIDKYLMYTALAHC